MIKLNLFSLSNSLIFYESYYIRIIITLFFLLSFNSIFSTNNKEVIDKHSVASLYTFSRYQNDSILNDRYIKIKKKALDSKTRVLALKEALELYNLSKKENNLKMEFKAAFLVADIYRSTNSHEKSIDFYRKSISILKLNKTEGGTSELFSNVDYAKSLLRIGGAYQLSSNDSLARVYYNELDKLNSLNDEILGYKAISYGNMAGIFQKDSLYDEAKKYASKAVDIHRLKNDKINEANALNNLSNIYLLESDYEKSRKIYSDAIDLIKNDSSDVAILVKADLYFNLAWAMRNLEDYEAYDKLETSYSYQDLVRDKEFKEMVERVTGEFNVNTVRQEEERKRDRAQRNTWILGISSFFIIVLLVFLLKQYKLRQKNLGLELSRQELMQQQKLEKVKNESQIRILNATLDGKESERKQIAETLHDSVSALLSSANLHLQACKKQFNGTTPIEVDKSQSIINEASQKIRDLSHTLVSSILLKFGLSYAIKDIAEKFSNSELKIDFDTRYIKRYDQGFEIKLYNIIQEFINNILKHSEASYAKITLLEKRKKLHLTIEDNGKGFDKTKIPEKDGLGINQIDARIQMMQGKFHIESGKGKGTLITIELPVFEKKLEVIS